MDNDGIRKTVREGYGAIAKGSGTCCGPEPSCCGTSTHAEDLSKGIGYSQEELASLPEGANLGLGCGNPIALASLREGEYVLDLGAGAGIDCFLAAKKVGATGKVIGVDMTPEMVEKARKNIQSAGIANVEFRLGEIEHLPVADNHVDIVISNCVINLSPDKPQVFRETYRALKPGGRLLISDIVLLRELPEAIRKSVEAYVGCIAGASLKEDYLSAIRDAGFSEVSVLSEAAFPIEYMANDPTAKALIKDARIPMEEIQKMSDSIVSVRVKAVKH